MPVNLSVIGRELPPVPRSWDSRDALLYALGVGAGVAAPSEELQYTTENSDGVTQQVLPTFPTVLVAGRVTEDLGDFDRGRIVHAEEEVLLHRPLPVEGSVEVRTRVVDVVDKGSGALIQGEARMTDPRDGQLVATVRSGLFVRGEGGFGGGKGGGGDAWTRPEAAPDAEVVLPTREEQALLYRLNGDRNPLHSDPVFAEKFGFPRPILHGLATFGLSGRGLLRYADGRDLVRIRGRMARPVFPGQSLTVRVWETEPDQVLFQTVNPDGEVVIDRGVAELAAPQPPAPSPAKETQ